MANFFDNLLARSVPIAGALAHGDAPVVQPLLPSRFAPSTSVPFVDEPALWPAEETGPDAARAAAPHVDGETLLAALPGPRAAPPRPAQAAPGTGPAPAQPLVPPGTGSARADAAQAERTAASVAPSQAAPAGVAVRAARTLPVQPVEAPRPVMAQARDPAHAPSPDASVQPGAPPAEQPAVVPSPGLTARPNIRRQDRWSEEEQPFEGPAPATPARRTAPPIVPATTISSRGERGAPEGIRSNHGGAQREAANERTVAAPPQIRVTIGRIEVRATQAVAPAPHPSPPKALAGPAMNLEDYLRRRDEGKL